MISKFTKDYIAEKAKKENIAIPPNYEERLETYCQLVQSYGHKLEFRKGRSLTCNSLNANAGLKNWSIVATPEYAYQLVSDPEIDLPFKITLGHELTHKERDLICLIPRKLKFYAWLNEAHADFGAAQKMFDSNRQVLLDSISFKLNYIKKHEGHDWEDYSHPSLARRRYYVENFDFDENLIRQIARDVNYRNNRVIEKVCNHFENIKLKG